MPFQHGVLTVKALLDIFYKEHCEILRSIVDGSSGDTHMSPHRGLVKMEQWSSSRLSVIRNVTQAPGAALAGGHMVWWRLLVSINIDIVVKKTRPKHVKWHDSFLQISKWMFAI